LKDVEVVLKYNYPPYVEVVSSVFNLSQGGKLA
jgi:hypothetical protein